MRFPPLFIGLSTIFWGFCSGLEIFSIAAALIFELPSIVKSRFELKSDDFVKICDLSLIATLILLLYSFLEQKTQLFLLFFATITPVILMPLLFAQLYSVGGKTVIGVKLGKSIHLTKPLDIRVFYLLLIVVASAVSDVKEIWFVAIFTAMVFILFSGSVRDKKSFFRYLLFCFTAFFFFLLVGASVVFINAAVQKKMTELYQNWYNSQTADPFKTSISMGETGYLKLSGKIRIRVYPKSEIKFPIYLKEADFNVLSGSSWFARSKNSTSTVVPDDDMDWQLFGVGEGENKMDVSIWMGKNGEGVLPLPKGAKRALKMDAAGIQKSPLGSILVKEGPDLLEFTATYDPLMRFEPLPDDKDLLIPNSEKQVVDKIMRERGLKGENDTQTLKNIEKFFSSFFYTLKLGKNFNRSITDNFLNKTKAGHCEYFATATVLMLRDAGIPARYSVGYLISEFSELERGYVGRERDAHAWVTAYIDGSWKTVDTTPALWRSVGESRKSIFEPLNDFFAWLKIKYENFKKRKSARFNRALILFAMILILFMTAKIFRKKRATITSKAEKIPYKIEGGDSPIYEILEICARRGFPKGENETLRAWTMKNGENLKDERDFMELVRLHEHLRFNKNIDKKAIKIKLRKKCAEWLKGDF